MRARIAAVRAGILGSGLAGAGFGRRGLVRGAAPAFVAAAAVVMALAPAAGAATTGSVFHIDRNKNRNQVHYGIHVDDKCRPVGSDPVYNYWLKREHDPAVTEPLRMFQQAAYGFQKQQVEDDGRIELRLRALPDHQLVVRVATVSGGCKVETFATIDGQQAYLDKVFVFADDGIFVPTLRYVELYGHSNDGHAVYEKITVDR
ncbi:MAG TPA: DUF4833 domain-containing protein [Candidatus Binatia bacterium]|jgi:hypothetical protein